MATTTNYGWTTPDDTALVKDGAAAIRTLGSSVDTTTKNLNPSTTLGDIEYRSSTANTNTRLGIGSSGQVLTVAAGVPSWASGFANPLTTTGDTIYSSSGTTAARLAIGSTGNVLTVAGGVPTWAAPAGGKVLQVVQGTTSTATNVSSTTFTDTTLSASITPSAATSKVLVMVSQFCNWGADDNEHGMALKLLRGSTDIYQPAGTAGEIGRLLFISAYTTTSPKGTAGNTIASFNYLDSPSTTSSTTYKTQQRAQDTTASGTSNTQPGSGTSTIILLEIGA